MGFSGISTLRLATVVLVTSLSLAGCGRGGGAPDDLAGDDGSRNGMILQISDLQRQLASGNARVATAEQALQRARAEADWLAQAAQAEPLLRARIAELEEEAALLIADSQRLGLLEEKLRSLEAENSRLSSLPGDGEDESPAGEMPGMQSGELAAAPPTGGYGEGTYAVHLASYRSQEAAADGWRQLRDKYPELLGHLSGHYSLFDVASLGGRFYRLKAGPFEGAGGAQGLCRSLNEAGEYCVVAVFDGQDLAE